MGTLLVSALDRLVRDKPGVAAAALVRPVGRSKARNIALVLVFDTDGQSIKTDAAVFSQMKNILVAVVDVTACSVRPTRYH